MTIAQDVLKASAPALVELFEIDFSTTNIPALAGSIMRLTPMTEAGANVQFGGDTFTAFPIQISGISQSSEGAPPRPNLSVSNIGKTLGAMAFQYEDIIGSTVTYTRTFSTYLNTGSRISLPPLRYYISKKTVHNKTILSFELRDFRDKERAFLPKRQMLKKDFPGLGINKNVR